MPVPRGIVAFDLDGTLLPNTTVSLHLGPWLCNNEIEELERLYAEGQITNSDIAEHEAKLFTGRTRKDAWRQLEDLSFIKGLDETVGWVRDASLLPVIATVTSSMAAEFVQRRYGFAAASGCELGESDEGVFLGTITRHFEAESKVTFVRELAEQMDLGLDDVVAIGDSTSDLPLFQAAGFSIALNASTNAREAADVELDTRDLRDVVPLIDRYFSQRFEL